VATRVISGGTDGIGRALAVDLLGRGDTVVVIGRNGSGYDSLVRAAGGRGTAHFVPADLRLVAENRRVAAEITARFPVVDTLVLAAAYVHRTRVLTEEGFEHTFALYYLSRHILASELHGSLTAAARPLILDTTVPGAPPTALRWDDLQLGEGFSWRAANLQTRRMGFLSGLRTGDDRLRYVLVNPGFVRTGHQGALGRPARAVVRLLAAALGTPPEKAVRPMLELISDPPVEPFSMYARGRRLPLTVNPGDRADAARLHLETRRLLETS
jgi:NAD(P)-dependent dehydrogenase (short-subunit alcohol dehydrogenase family)